MAQRDLNLQIYLAEIRRTPLLTPERERQLARQLIRHNDAAARDAMFLANLRFVVKIALQFAHRGVDLQDLIAEGNIGLLRAVERFNPELNVRFTTYATLWIKQAIRRALLRHELPFPISEYMRRKIGRWNRAAIDLKIRLGRGATVEEMAEHLSMPLAKAREVEGLARCLRRVGQGEGQEASLDRRLQDRGTSAEQGVEDRDALQFIHQLLGQLKPADAQVLRLRYGLQNHPPQTLEAIALQFGVSREYIRQVESQALQRARRLVYHGSQPGDSGGGKRRERRK